jgi:Na+/glutamate symporter
MNEIQTYVLRRAMQKVASMDDVMNWVDTHKAETIGTGVGAAGAAIASALMTRKQNIASRLALILAPTVGGGVAGYAGGYGVNELVDYINSKKKTNNDNSSTTPTDDPTNEAYNLDDPTAVKH